MRLLVVTFMLCISGCAALPTKQSQRVAQQELDIPGRWQSQIDSQVPVRNSLLELFDDAQLEQSVGQALAHNLDLRLAAERVVEAGYLTKVSQASLLPETNSGVSGNRSGGTNQSITNKYDINLNASWEVDLWGKLRSNIREADFNQQALEEDRLALQDSIAAQVMQAWFDVLGSYQLLQVEKQRLNSLHDTQVLIQQRYIQGLGTLDDLDTTRVDSANVKASVTQFNQAFQEGQRILNILLGQYPTVDQLETTMLPELNFAPQAGIPLDVITNRPDIRAAWTRILAADERVNVAHKAMYPSLTITGSTGSESDVLKNLLIGASVWNLAANFTAPIFNAGRLENELNAADSRAKQTYLDYLNVVLDAFGEVENALGAETLLAEREQLFREALQHAKRSEQNFRNDYLNGNSDVLQLLNTQRLVFSAQSSLVEVKVARLKNRVALAMALGKGV